MKMNAALSAFDRILGAWTVTGSHPYLPGRALRGNVTFERIEGGAYVRMHSKIDDKDIPEGVAIVGTDGDDGSCTMLYYDERGVSRHYEVTFEEDAVTWSRDNAKFAQRFRVTIESDGTMKGKGTMKKEGADWEPDLELMYQRVR